MKPLPDLILAVLRDARGKPVGVREIVSRAALHPRSGTEVKRALRELVRDGKVEKEAKRYRLPGTAEAPPAELTPSKPGARPASAATVESLLAGFRPAPRGKGRGPRRVVGVLRKKPAGFGFLQPLSARDEDLYLPAAQLATATDGDLLIAEVVPGRGGRTAGRLVEVVERRRTHGVGIYHARGRASAVEPLAGDEAWAVPVERHDRARDGQAVRFSWPQGPRDLGRIEAVLGAADAPGLESLAVAFDAGFSDVFPAETVAAAEAFGEVSAADRAGRVDLTALPLVTIDGEDARDFDDAVYVEGASRVAGSAGGRAEAAGRSADRLIVAIADVSHYVREGQPLDVEALRRGTSVYLPDRVLPMLPERLSNGLCSLVPNEDRLCLVADMVIDDEGQTSSVKLYPAVMRSAARCTYTQVQAALDGQDVPLPPRVTERFERMAALAARLSEMRRRRGAIDFNLPEAKVVLGPDGRVAEIARRPRNAAHRLIEEFMLAANEAVARHFAEAGLPTVYRVHDEPDDEKLADFAALARAHGFEVDPGDDVDPRALQAFLRRLEGHPEERALNNLLLRAMMQALYSAENIGHYGLGARTYLHFTSPIRRYPDLVVHRLLRRSWQGRGPAEGDLGAVAARCSERERAAMGVEREVDAYYAALLMRDHIGESFEGTIDAAVEAGLFVELDRWLVSGLVPAAELGEEAVLEREKQRWVLPRSGRAFRIGGRLRVTVASVNVGRRQIDLTLAEPVISRGMGGERRRRER
ncbi:MAG TPA: ribonuclease R [Myxococcales bacterium]|nr:ribonuclease R [Myxococcales bacterium]